MASIHGRVILQEVTRTHCYRLKNKEYRLVEGVRIKLTPTGEEPFGSATPGGQLEMVIVEPASVKIFNDAPIGQAFDVVFSPVEEEKSEEQP